uniref:TANK binding kinase 1 ubiquitin-like domain-containing protein n=1 Tax=Glossina palpalis gambiensis TaxID=67801 RepID=A0A1B0BZF5_9MUSC
PAHLPAHYHLSEGLKILVTPLLAGLLEENREKTWSFDRFFQEVTNILRKRVIHVFFTNRTSSVEIFLEPEELIEHFRERILMQTKVPMKRQILLFNNEHLERHSQRRTRKIRYSFTATMIIIFVQRYQQVNVSSQNLRKQYVLYAR